MADNTDVKQFLEEAQGKNTQDDDVMAGLRELAQRADFDFDIETLTKLNTIVSGLPDNHPLKEVLKNRIGERFGQLESENQQPSQQPPANSDNEAPSVAEQMASYDLKKKFEQALKNGNNAEAEQIAAYTTQQLEHAQLTEDNAPVIKDYLDILQLSGKTIDERLLQNVEEKLQTYDANHGLEKVDISAKKYAKNTEKWEAFMAEHDLLGNALPNFIPADLSNEKKQETYNIIKSIALTELALNEPDKNAEHTLREALGKYLSVYATTRDAILNKYLQEHTEEINQAYLQSVGMTLEEFQEKNKDLDEEGKRRLKDEMVRFSCTYAREHGHIDDAVNAEFVQRNAVFASRIAQKINAESTPQHVINVVKNFTKKHPQVIKIAKAVLLNAGVAMAFGPAGVAALSAHKFGSALLASYRRFKGIEKRQGFWNKIKGAAKDTVDLVKNFKSFRTYLKENPEEKLALTKAGVSAAISTAFAGVAAFNGFLDLGMVGGHIAPTAQNLATSASASLWRRATSLVATAAFYKQTKALKDKKIAPKKVKMLEILGRYATNAPVKKSLFGKAKSPAEAMYDKLTGMFASTNEAKIAKKLDELVPNMSAEDKQKLIKLSQDIIGLQRDKGMAIGGVAGGLIALEASHFMNDGGHVDWNQHESSTDDIETGNTGNDVDTGSITGGIDEQQETSEPATDVVETDVTHPIEIQDEKNYDFAVKATPTPTYQELMKIGVLSEDRAHELMNGKSYITSRELNDFIKNEAQFTDEQAKEFNDFVNDHNARLAEFKADRALRDAHLNNHNDVTDSGNNATPNGENNADNETNDGNDGNNGNDGSANNNGGEDLDNTSADLQPSVSNVHTMTGHAHRTLFGYQKDGREVEIIDDRATSSPRSFSEAAHQLHDETPGKSRYSIEDNEGNSAKVKISKDGDSTVKIKYSDGHSSKTHIDGQTGVETTTYKNTAVAADTVGDANGVNDDEVVKAISHARGRLQLLRDGDNQKDYYVRAYDEHNQVVGTSAAMSKKAASSILKEFEKETQRQ